MELLLWVKCLNIKDEYGNVTLFKCFQSRWGSWNRKTNEEAMWQEKRVQRRRFHQRAAESPESR